jgi:putative serine protease PepD
MTWEPTPPSEPPSAADGVPRPPLADPDPAGTPTLDGQRPWTLPPPPAGTLPSGPPPPRNPAWPAGDEPTRVVLPPRSEPTVVGDVGTTYGSIPPPPPPPYPPTMDAQWPAPVGPTPPSGPRRAARAVGATLGAGVLVLAGFGVRALTEDEAATTVVRSPMPAVTVPDVTIDPEVEPLAAVAAAVSASVVQIEPGNGVGSGVVYDDGLILTNAHVVGGATTVTVRTFDGSAVDGRVLGVDTSTDIAVVEVNAELPAVAIDQDELVVGQSAVALGSPFGLDQTVTAGIVSAVNRSVDNDKGVVVNMIQTDASINPGNSGGALVNRNAELIGINTAIFSQSGENNGIGFAIPIDRALDSADDIVSGRSVVPAGLGLTGPPETPGGGAGAYVQSVNPGGAAEAAGIRPGDTITAVEGQEVRSFEQLRGFIGSYRPGDDVVVEVERDGETIELDVTLGQLGG